MTRQDMSKDKFYLRKIILVGADLTLLFLSLYFALWIRYGSGFENSMFDDHIPIFRIAFPGWIIIFYIFDLYDLNKIRNKYFAVYSLIWAVMASMIISIIFFYIFHFILWKTPKTILLLIGGLSIIMIGIWRYIFSQALRSKQMYKRVAIVGMNDRSIAAAKEIMKIEGSDYKIAGFIDAKEGNGTAGMKFANLGSSSNIRRIIKEHKIDQLVIAFDPREYPEVLKRVSDCLHLGVKIMELPIFYEQAANKIPAEYIDQLWFIYNMEEADKKTLEKAQDFLDGAVSVIGLAITLALGPLIALAIRIEGPGPILFSQIRLGRKEKKFKLYKFRTMVTNAEEKTGAVWAEENDPRVTRIGRFLRKTRLDELPQFYNIFKGEMSLIGPRPERPEFVEKLKKEIPFYYKRHIVRPGLTGWAQINYRYGASEEDAFEKLQYDLYYIKNRSLFLYFKILLRTIRIVITQKGR